MRGAKLDAANFHVPAETALLEQPDPTRPPTAQRSMEGSLADDKLKFLARALGRQAARRHLHRGYSIYEIVMVLAVGALAIAALWYGGVFNLSAGPR